MYDNPPYTDNATICGIQSNYNANKTCNLTYVAPVDMKSPVLVYYELDNFHQNYRRYTVSRDASQLLGSLTQSSVDAQNCEPLNKLGNVTINPCGLIANTFFNDKFTLLPGAKSASGEPLIMHEHGIAWSSDIEYMFKQPDGFNSSECPEGMCNASCCGIDPTWSCKEPHVDKDGTCWRYTYPNDDTTQYLYETYPDIISPLEGVMNEHFIVWMRVATLPRFMKLYGWFDQDIKAGTELIFQVDANYAVERFKGSKTLVITTNNIFGGRNPYMGNMFWIMGVVCIGIGLLIMLKQTVRPRKLGDPAWLHYKQD